MVQRPVKELQNSPPTPSYGKILVQLQCLGKVLDSRQIATYTEIFIQIGRLGCKISTDKLFRTHMQTDTHLSG